MLCLYRLYKRWAVNLLWSTSRQWQGLSSRFTHQQQLLDGRHPNTVFSINVNQSLWIWPVPDPLSVGSADTDQQILAHPLYLQANTCKHVSKHCSCKSGESLDEAQNGIRVRDYNSRSTLSSLLSLEIQYQYRSIQILLSLELKAVLSSKIANKGWVKQIAACQVRLSAALSFSF